MMAQRLSWWRRPAGRVAEFLARGRRRGPCGTAGAGDDDRPGREQALELSRKLEAVLANIAQGVNIVDADGRVVLVNRGFMDLYGFPPELGVPGTPIEAFIRHRLAAAPRHAAGGSEDDVDALVATRLQQLLAAGSGQIEETLADGRIVEIRRQRLPEGLLVSTYTDVTERRRAAAELRESEERFRAIAESVPVPLAISRSDVSAMLFANQRALEIYSVPAGAARDRILSAWVNPEDRLDLVAEVARAGRVDGREAQLRKADGTRFWALVSARAMTYAGQPAILTVSTDITERRQMEQALRASEARFRAIVEDQTEFITRFIPDFTLTFVNQALAHHLGRDRTALLGTSVLDLMSEVERERFLTKIAGLTPDRPIAAGEVETTGLDGGRFWEHWTDRALFDRDGHPVEYQSVGRDVTPQKLAEAELRETEERLRTIAEGVPLPIVITRLDQPETLFANDQARETFGLEVGDRGSAIIRHWEQPAQREEMIRRVQRDGRIDGFEAQLRRADGTPYWALLSARLTAFGGDEAMLIAAADITERRRIERALRESEARLAACVAYAPVGMFVKDLEGRYVLMNDEIAKATGRPLEEVLGRTAAEVLPAARAAAIAAYDREVLASGAPTVHEDVARQGDHEVWRMIFRFPIRDPQGEITHIGGFYVDISEQKAMEQRLRESERRFRTFAEAHPVPLIIARVEDQEPLFVNDSFRELFQLGTALLTRADITGLYLQPSDRSDAFRLLIGQGRVDGHELLMRRRDGSELPVALTSRLIDYEGSRAAVTSFTDLTEKKRAEAQIARQREALHQTEKISALGTLLAGVAHELNNPLSVVVGQSTLLEETAPDAATEQRAAKIRAAAERCARIVRTFLTMARNRPMERGPVDVNALAHAALELLAYGLRTAGIKVVLDLADDLPPVWGDGDQLHQVLTNLIVNAQHALQEVEPPRELRLSTRSDGGEVRLEIADNGPGIDPEMAKRVFEPFFTTKPSGVGTGIGLSVCHGIVTAHDGSIELESTPGRGASFVVRLPVLRADQTAPADGADRAARAGRGRVLVVDDEPDVGELYAEVLRLEGHEVIVTGSGREALELLEGEPFDLVVSDLRMPDVDGPAIYRALAGTASELASRLIFVTGDALSHQIERFLRETGAEVLEKPVSPRQLVARVRAKLAAPD